MEVGDVFWQYSLSIVTAVLDVFWQYSLSIVTAVLGGDIAFVGDITFGWVGITVLGGDVVVFVGGITFGGLSPDLVLKGVLALFVDPIEVLELVAIMVSVCIMENRLYFADKIHLRMSSSTLHKHTNNTTV